MDSNNHDDVIKAMYAIQAARWYLKCRREGHTRGMTNHGKILIELLEELEEDGIDLDEMGVQVRLRDGGLVVEGEVV